MNHLEESKANAYERVQGSPEGYTLYGIQHALIAIAEQLEKMNNITEGELQCKAEAKPQEGK